MKLLVPFLFLLSSFAFAEPQYKTVKSPKGLKYHTGLLKRPDSLIEPKKTFAALPDCANLPESFDLRPLGLVPPVKDQGQCGSCWSFSKTASLESALLGQGKSLNLSEQELVSCDRDQYGCNGGLLADFSYQIGHGQSLETDFPYKAADVSCKSGLPVAAKGISFKYVGAQGRAPTEQELKCALYTYKTVPWITVGATDNWGSPPSSESVPYTRCSRSQTNHAVGVVGWNKNGFIMKNSWGPSWGDKGFMTLKLGCDSFGEEVAFIEVEKVPQPSPTVTPVPSPVPSVVPQSCKDIYGKLADCIK